MKSHGQDRFRISQEAALWLIRLEEDDSAQGRAEFAAWSRLSPQHVEEFLFARATVREFDGVDGEKRIDLGTLEGGADVEELRPHLTLGMEPSPQARMKWSGISAVAALIALAVTGWLLLGANDSRTYATATGDQQTVKLGDGSVMYLNTRSRAEVRFTAQGRDIRLLEGEALFAVERDPARPFRVTTDDAMIQALGTQFNVYRRTGATRVSVVEGAVQVAAVRLAAGAEAEIARGKVIGAPKPDVSRAVAWRSRRLVFQADPLQTVADEFNRYEKQRPIRLEGENIRRRTVSGVFDADDPRPLIEFLQHDPELAVSETGREILIRAR